eukprot:m.172797 g.172797  ORF g.172797 m.172797 type:complete len:67 (+) comp25224_c0_seq11:8-208(+)
MINDDCFSPSLPRPLSHAPTLSSQNTANNNPPDGKVRRLPSCQPQAAVYWHLGVGRLHLERRQEWA